MVLTLDELKVLLSYDPATGDFTWRVTRKWARHVAGDKAGYVNRVTGYRYITIERKNYYEHRLAWYFMTGKWPHQIDHINRDKLDNRFSNLREVDRYRNMRNQSLRKDTKSGYKGVVWHKRNQHWQAQLSYRVDGKLQTKYLGSFQDPLDAAKAYDKAAVEVFGEHACTNQMMGLTDVREEA